MAFALPKLSLPGGDANDLSFRDRFHAWWNGYELRQPAQDPVDLAAADDDGTSGVGEAPAGTADGDDLNNWSDSRKKVAQDVWTSGFIVPGGVEYVQELVGCARLTAAETMLEIGVGMGGGTRAIIDKFGNYVTGYEGDAALADEARKQAIAHDMDGKLDIKSQPLPDIELKRGYFRAALMRDVLFTIQDKDEILDRVCDSLKAEDAYLIITDFLFDSPDVNPEVRAWADGERMPVYPWNIKALKEAIESRGLIARITEDESQRYCSMVTGAWSEYIKDLRNKKVSSEVGEVISAEADYWKRRTAAIESGALRYYRIEGVKQG